MKYIIISVLGILLFSCECAKEDSQHSNTETPSATEEQVVEQKPRHFSSSETGLPTGIVVGGEQIQGNPSNNYISIQDETGKVTVVKNLDWQLWSEIKKGDVIR